MEELPDAEVFFFHKHKAVAQGQKLVAHSDNAVFLKNFRYRPFERPFGLKDGAEEIPALPARGFRLQAGDNITGEDGKLLISGEDQALRPRGFRSFSPRDDPARDVFSPGVSGKQPGEDFFLHRPNNARARHSG